MKRIQYRFCSGRINRGTEESPAYEDVLLNVSMPWNEVNEEIAKKEAVGGEYTVADDGQPEPDTTTAEEILDALLGVSRYE